jgi:hypothetical protein
VAQIIPDFNKELNSEHFILQFVTNSKDFNLGLNFCSQYFETYDDIFDLNIIGWGREYYILFSLAFVQISIGFRMKFK